MRSHVLWRVLSAQALSSVGTSMSTVALAFMVYKLTGSMLDMGGVMAVSVFPLVVTSWVGGAFLDRFSAKWVMVLSDAARAVLIFLMPFLAERAVWLIYVVAALVGVGTAFFNPGQMKLIGELSSREQLVKANSYLSVSRDGAELIGYLAGGAIVAAVGYRPAFFTDAGSYVLSALLLVGLPRVARAAGPRPGVGRLLLESPQVFARLWRHPGLRTNLLLACLSGACIFMMAPNAYGLVLKVFHRGGMELGIMEMVVGCGLILGGLIVSRLTLKGDKNTYVFVSFVAGAACMAGVYFSDLLWLSVGLMGLGGIANVGMVVPSITMYQEVPAVGDKGRLLSLRGGFGQLAVTVGYVVGGLLGTKLEIKQVFLLAGLAAIGLTVLIYVPYRIGAGRRARAAFAAAMDTGARRVAARKAAELAAIGGSSEIAWAMAAEEAAMEERTWKK